jgi:anti-sigma-K factor RskA
VNCNDVDELIGAYAIDALDEEESRDVRAHLIECERHAEEARNLRRTASLLATTARPILPPPALRSRILAAVGADAAEPGPTGATPRPLRGRRVFSSYPRWFWAAAAAAAVIAGLAAWNVVLLNQDDDGLQRLASRARIVATLESTGARGGGVVLYFPDEKKALVIGDGLQALDPSKDTYQLWEIDGDTPKSIGLMQADAGGHAVAVVPFDGARAHTLAITIEPRGGSPQPTSDPIFIAKG